MNLELINKTALISGSTKGIGFAIASQLASEGARVIVNGRSDKAVHSALEQIRKQVPEAKVEGFAGDLSTEKAVQDLTQRFPRLIFSSTTSEFMSPSPSRKLPMRSGGDSSRSMCSAECV